MPSLPAPPPDQLVTSSELVRHFGLWQGRAARAPLYILHRGRPRFVLTSIETMEVLCAPHALAPTTPPANHSPIDPVALLDAITDIVLVADGDGVILATSRAARAHFGNLAAIGAPIAAIAPPAARTMLGEALRRVTVLGVGDVLEIPSAAREARTLRLSIEPAGAGILIVAKDGTAERAQARADAIEQAHDAAMQATAGLAAVTINPRGYVTDPSLALVALTGLTAETLRQSRFVTLAETGARETLSNAVEAAFAGEGPCALDSIMCVDHADPMPVRIGLAPIRIGATVTGAVALIAAR